MQASRQQADGGILRTAEQRTDRARALRTRIESSRYEGLERDERQHMLGEVLFTTKELAKHLKVSQWAVRHIFRGEPGVLLLGTGRRSLMRVPQSVLERVIRRNTVP